MEEKQENDEALRALFISISGDATISNTNKLIMFQLAKFETRLKKNSKLALEFEKWKFNNPGETTPHSEKISFKSNSSDSPTFFNEANSSKPKYRFRRGSSSSEKNLNKVPRIQLSSSLSSDRNVSPGRLSSRSSSNTPLGSPKTSPTDSLDSPCSTKSSPIPLRNNNEGDVSLYTSRPMQEEKKSTSHSFNPFTAIYKRSDGSPRNPALVNHNHKFPLDADTTKDYLHRAKKLKDLPDSFVEGDHEVLVTTDKTNFFLVDKKGLFGQGRETKIYHVWNLDTKQLLAGKMYDKKCNTKNQLQDIETEVKNLKIKNKLHGYFTLADTSRIILMDYAPGINSLHYLYEVETKENEDPVCVKKKQVSPLTQLKLAYKIAEQLEALHQTPLPDNELDGMLHRDIKPDNVQVDDSGNDLKVELIDLEQAIPNRKDGKNSTLCAGTAGRHVPEQIGEEPKPYTKASDYYQLGLLIGEIISQFNLPQCIAQFLNESKNEGLIREITLDHIKTFQPDVYKTKHSELKPLSTTQPTEEAIQELVHHYLIFPVLCKFVNSLTAEDPRLRLQNTSLADEIASLKKLELTLFELTRNWQEQIENVLTSQLLFLDLSHLVASEYSSIQLNLNHFVSQLIREKSDDQYTPFTASS